MIHSVIGLKGYQWHYIPDFMEIMNILEIIHRVFISSSDTYRKLLMLIQFVQDTVSILSLYEFMSRKHSIKFEASEFSNGSETPLF
jgi:hypothetical protein